MPSGPLIVVCMLCGVLLCLFSANTVSYLGHCFVVTLTHFLHRSSQHFARMAPCQRKIEELLLHFEQTENWYSFKCALVNVELFRIWWHPVNRPDLMSAWRVLSSNTMASGSYDIVQEYSQAICTYTDKHGHDPAKLTEFMYDLSCFMREFCINLTKQRAILEEAAEKKQAAARKHKRATGVDLEEEDDGTENPLLAGMPTLLRTEVPSIGFILEEAGALAPLLSEIDRNLQQELGKAGANKLSRVRPLGAEGSFGSDSDREEHSYFDDSCMPVRRNACVFPCSFCLLLPPLTRWVFSFCSSHHMHRILHRYYCT